MKDLRGLTGITAIDRSALGETVRTSLQACNMQVPMLVENIEKALVACETHQPDVLFISFVFNGKPALELMRAIRAAEGGVGRINPKLPIIISSHNPQPKQVKACIAAGAHEFLALPTSHLALTGLVHRALSGEREWISAGKYTGPDRRRQTLDKLPFPDRRKT
jgi:two-component system chemotaxis response regulator CheY